MIGATRHARHSRLVRGLGSSLAIGTLVTMAGLSAPVAVADPVPPEGTPATVTADALPTWQINGIVWDTETVGNIVYATGSFTKTRPPGTKIGDKAEITRNNLLAFDITTGKVTSFNHTLNAQGRRIDASPDGKTLYVGGDFTKVDGKAHQRIAAFTIKTGALKSTFAPKVNSSVRALEATNKVVYIGGTFTSVGGKARERLAAVRASDGYTYAWKASADRVVHALVMAPGGKRLIVGGAFNKLNGAKKVGIGALSTTTAKQVKWTSRPIPDFIDYQHFSMVTDLVVADGVVYGTADGESYHYFDGRFAAKASNGNLVWLDNCYGATYSGYVRNKVFYAVGHPHDCTSVKAFGQTDPVIYKRAIAETTYATGRDSSPSGKNSHYSKQKVPSLLHWYPELTPGKISGANQAAWAVTGAGYYIALAGEFLTVNGVPQQGLTRFASKSLAPNKQGPINSDGIVPTVTSPSTGTVHLAYKRTWDVDNAKLTYTIKRDGVQVFSGSTSSEFWALTPLSYDDRGLRSGDRHRYTVTVTDPFNNVTVGAASAEVVVR